MKTRLFFCVIAMVSVGLIAFPAFALGEFVKAIGGPNDDAAGYRCLTQLSDGKLVVTGHTSSFTVGNDDLLLAKFDLSGELQWMRTFGIPGNIQDHGRSVIEAYDSGLVVAGKTEQFGSPWSDLLLAKFNASGNHLWTKRLGWSGNSDYGTCLIQASDNGLVVLGYTYSVGAGICDLLLVKFDALGNHLWTRTLGGPSIDGGNSVIEASDSGLVVTGRADSFGAGDSDLLLAKFDAAGSLLWAKTLGGAEVDIGYAVVEASSGGFVVAGYTKSFGAGNCDLLLAKFDAVGNHLWTRTLGGSADDVGYFSVAETSDGGLVVIGRTNSFGAGNHDLLLAKFDASGNYLWTWVLGGSQSELGECVIEASDGGLVATGHTYSYGTGNYDLFLAKFNSQGYTCLGDYVTPTITSPSDTAVTITPTVMPHVPPIDDPSPTITSPDPTATLVCSIPWPGFALDIRPRSCPNPFNIKWLENIDNGGGNEHALPKKGGVMPAAIVGSESFDVTEIDVSTLLLGGVEPLRSGYEDVTRPASGNEECDCTTGGPDEIMDLTLKFSRQEIAATFGPVEDGDVVVLTITGALLDGTHFEASDCVTILAEKVQPMFSGNDRVVLRRPMPNPFNPTTRMSYFLPKEDFVKLSVYDIAGRLVEQLVSEIRPAGEHFVEWDAKALPSGLYFCRLEVGNVAETHKMILLK